MTEAPPERPEAGRIDVDATRDALWRLRYAQDLVDNPLLRTAAVSAALVESGLPDTPSDEAFVLGQLLGRIVAEALDQARRRSADLDRGPTTGPVSDRGAATGPVPGRGRASGPVIEPSRDALAADFAANDPSREALSAVYYRFLTTDGATVEGLASRAGVARRTFERRLERGVRMVTELFRSVEEQSRRDADGQSRLGDATGGRGARASATEPGGRRGEPLPNLSNAKWAERAARWREGFARGEGFGEEDRAGVAEWAGRAPADATSYRLTRIARLVEAPFRLDAEFVPLTLRGDPTGGDAAGGTEVRFGALADFLSAAQAPAVVLLGPPGSGKSTTLRRFELEAAVAGVAGQDAPLTLFVSLGGYGSSSPDQRAPAPAAWLADQWTKRAPLMPPLEAAVSEGGVVFLLDAIDELPQNASEAGVPPVQPWREWLQGLTEMVTISGRPNRAVFTCRTLDYTLPLSRPSFPVPQAWLEPLDDNAARLLVRAHAPENADARLAMLDRSTEQERAVLRWPFFLRLFAEQAPTKEATEAGASGLLSDAVRRALIRELERGNPELSSGRLLTPHDRRRLLAGAQALPSEGPLLNRFAVLGNALHERAMSNGRGRGRARRAEALQLLADQDAAEILGVAEAMGLVDVDAERDDVHFTHQLLQEYFAASWARLDPSVLVERVRAGWRSEDVRPGLDETLAALSAGEPLPPLPATGWEEVAKLAVVMSDSPAELVDQLSTGSLPLAARAAAAPAVRSRLPEELIAGLAARLVERSTDPAADLRARIAAGRALGEIGDPRLTAGRGPDGSYIAGPFVALMGGTFLMGEAPVEGDDAPNAQHAHDPAHRVHVEPFEMATYPVTNAEWRAFMHGGGYDDPRWWPGDAAQGWWRGDGTAHAVRGNVRLWWRRFREQPELLEEVLAKGQIDRALHEEWQVRLALDEAGLEQYLVEHFPSGRCTQPRYWDDPVLSDLSQPVVGICWFEAQAYTLWLAEQTGWLARLPTEAEWEFAARGLDGRGYPYGDYLDTDRCNVRSTRVRTPTPIGVFPGGESPEGVTDLTGNVLEWTSTAVRPYPYDAGDGRESPDTAPDVARILRGGSWINAYLDVRAAVRYPYYPDARDAIDGLRLVRRST